MSFSKDFWGSFKIVLDRYEEGRNSLNILINFIKDKITIEEKYYAKMSKLCSKPTGWTEKWTVGECWEGFKRFQDDTGKVQSSFTSKLQSSVYQPLFQLKKDQETQKANLLKESQRLDAGYEKLKDSLQKAKARYYKLMQEFEQSSTELLSASSMKPKDAEKLKAKNANDKINADSANSSYLALVEEFRTYQKNYETSMKQILDQFEEMELKRIESIKSVMEEFLNIQESMLMEYKEHVPQLRSSIQKIDSKKDVQNFIEVNRTEKAPEPLVEYEPYENRPMDTATEATKSKSKRKTKLFGSLLSHKKEHKNEPIEKVEEPKEKSLGKEEPTVRFAENIVQVSEEPIPEPPPEEEVKEPEQEMETPDPVSPTPDPVSPTPEEEKVEETQPTSLENNAGEGEKELIVALAMYDYITDDESDINFHTNSFIIVTKKDGEIEGCPGWMEGIVEGHIGLFPSNYVEILTEVKKCEAIYDFYPTSEDELPLRKGEIVIIHSELDGWYSGYNMDGYSGLFPSNYVNPID